MQFMILRKADKATEVGALLKPSTDGVCIKHSVGQWNMVEGHSPSSMNRMQRLAWHVALARLSCNVMAINGVCYRSSANTV